MIITIAVFIIRGKLLNKAISESADFNDYALKEMTLITKHMCIHGEYSIFCEVECTKITL